MNRSSPGRWTRPPARRVPGRRDRREHHLQLHLFRPAAAQLSQPRSGAPAARLPCGCTWDKFDGVVLGRTDFMVTVRGTNVYQTAVENIIGAIDGVSPFYQLVLDREGSNDKMTVRMSSSPPNRSRIATTGQGLAQVQDHPQGAARAPGDQADGARHRCPAMTSRPNAHHRQPAQGTAPGAGSLGDVTHETQRDDREAQGRPRRSWTRSMRAPTSRRSSR